MASWNEWVPGTNMTLSQVLDALKSAEVGLDVQDKLYWSFFRIVELAIKEGNANFEVAMARQNFATLLERLDSMDSNTRNFDVNWINKNLGKLDQTFMSEEFLQQMAGTTPINAVPADGAVTTEKLAEQSVTLTKTDFVTTGKNLFDLDKRVTGFVVHAGTGELSSSSSGNSATGLIPVKPSTNYYKNSTLALVFYDINGRYLRGTSTSDYAFTTDSDTFYVRFNYASEHADIIQLEEGLARTEYEPFYYRFSDAVKRDIRAQLNSPIYYNESMGVVEIPQGTSVKDNQTVALTKSNQIIFIDNIATSNKFVYFDNFSKEIKVKAAGGSNQPHLMLLGSFIKNDNKVVFDNYIGSSLENFKAFKVGKNIVDPSKKITGQVINSGGGLVASPSGSSVYHQVLVKPNTTYTLTGGNQFAFYNSGGGFIRYNNTGAKTFTTTNDTRMISINVGPNEDYIQLEEGAMASFKVPYTRVSVLDTNENDRINNKLSVVIDLNENTSQVQRIGDVNDIMSMYPFNEIRVCNLITTSWGAKKVTYEEESDFKRDGSNGDVMVEIPKHYFKRYVKDGKEYLSISGEPLEGYQIDPVFIENGTELDKIYISAYEGFVDESQNTLHSKTKVIPTTKFTLTQMRDFARNKGAGYGLFDYRTLAMLQRLYVIYFADRASERVGMGMTLFTYQSNNHAKAVETVSNSTSIRVGVPNNNNRHKIGQNVQISDNPWNIAVPMRKITNIQVHSNGESTISFSGSPINITAGATVIASRVQDTGYTDEVTGLTGMSSAFGGDNGWEAIKFLGIENLWGNAWHELDGIALDQLVPYVGVNMSDYTSSLADVKANYVPLSKHLPLQESNHQGAGSDNSDEYIKNLLYDALHPAYQLPFELGASNTTHYTDPYYSYADVSNMNSGEYLIPAHGGGIDHNYRAGLFTMRFWYTPDQTWNSMHNCRLIYKPI